MTLVAVASDPDPPPTIDPTVARARAGDRDAFAQLYHQHVDRVYARLTRLVGPVPERDDLLQQTFLQVHRGLPGFRGDAGVATFIHRIAVNVALDHLRARRRRPLDLDDAAVTAMAAAAPDPASRAASRQDLARVFALLGELTPEQRVAFVLIAIEGLTAREAGELLGAARTCASIRSRVASSSSVMASSTGDRPRPAR